MISLISVFEENEINGLEIELRKFSQCFNKKSTNSSIEQLVLTTIKKLVNVKHWRDEAVVFNQLMVSLECINDAKLPFKMIVNKAINQWAKAKITTKTIPLLN